MGKNNYRRQNKKKGSNKRKPSGGRGQKQHRQLGTEISVLERDTKATLAVFPTPQGAVLDYKATNQPKWSSEMNIITPRHYAETLISAVSAGPANEVLGSLTPVTDLETGKVEPRTNEGFVTIIDSIIPDAEDVFSRFDALTGDTSTGGDGDTQRHPKTLKGRDGGFDPLNRYISLQIIGVHALWAAWFDGTNEACMTRMPTPLIAEFLLGYSLEISANRANQDELSADTTSADTTSADTTSANTMSADALTGDTSTGGDGDTQRHPKTLKGRDGGFDPLNRYISLQIIGVHALWAAWFDGTNEACMTRMPTPLIAEFLLGYSLEISANRANQDELSADTTSADTTSADALTGDPQCQLHVTHGV